ncbi:type IV pilus secretin PilQ [Candidatus Pelagibacter sp.]|jgi:type IV pilus assembly protein PilQ|nr:type IV pilus secretin PilQ [Candidatus Pelagibacter sp.]
MNIKKIKLVSSFLVLLVALTNCTSTGQFKKSKPFKHNTPLIKENIKKSGQTEIAKTLEMGPKPIFGDTTKLNKRKQISSQASRNYLIIPDKYTNLKQRISLKFQNLDFKETMQLMGRIGEINILVGDEVAGAISAELVDVPWDKAFQAILDMKNYASDIDVTSNLIRVHSPETLTSQENYKSERAQAVKKKIEVEDSVEPIISEIFRLYYISPAQAKITISELFSAGTGENSYMPIQITEEITTRSIIVRGKSSDLDMVDKVIKEIDVRTKQVLIEAFIVEANSDFERALGVRLGGYYQKYGNVAGGVAGTSSGSAAGTSLDDVGALGAATDSITNFPVTGATSGIGLLRKTTTGVLKAEITALESIGLGKTISNPKIFTLDNQLATITQGEEIPYQTTSEGTTSTSFKEAALKLQVTPSIIGDGNVLLQIQVNNDTPNRTTGSDEPPINKMEIITKLLIADGDIVVIGGIKKNVIANSKQQTPGLGDMPVIGNLFKGKSKTDNLDELLIFIAPRVL